MKQWKEIEFTEGLYSCSEDGEIRSNKSGRILSGSVRPDGYRGIGLMMPTGKQKTFMLHRLVASLWCEGEFETAQVDHKDKNRLNNHPSNLEWVTQEANLMRRDNTSHKEKVVLISPQGIEVEVEVLYQFVKQEDLHYQSVQKLIRGTQTKHKGWTIKGA